MECFRRFASTDNTWGGVQDGQDEEDNDGGDDYGQRGYDDDERRLTDVWLLIYEILADERKLDVYNGYFMPLVDSRNGDVIQKAALSEVCLWYN